ncbi:MAG: hypothetical protein CVU38_03050 [Chloroflexi bacterium HGW-Chloroflexi-1]|nr:MAG: hypothetical protein CVU38_03050 [Chloroflexi bacterium HGW-Chloroflexi-1]
MAKQAGKQTWRKKLGNLYGYLFVAPIVGMWLIFGAYPYVRGILIALQDYRLMERQSWSFFNSFIGFANFIELLQDPRVWQGVKASALLYVSVYPFVAVLALFTAVVLNRVKTSGLATVYRVLITLPWVIPVATSMPMWLQIYEPNYGYLNHFLSEVLKIWPDPPAWTSSASWYWPAIGLACIWKSFGHNALLFLIGLYNIPSELYEAARLDGANSWQEFRFIELPGIRNIMLLFIVTHVAFLGAGMVEMMTFGEGPANIGKTLALYGWQQAFQGNARLGYGAAMALFAGLVNLGLVTIVFKFFKSEKA